MWQNTYLRVGWLPWREGGGATVLFAHRRKFISGMKNAPSSRPSPPFKMAIYLISCGMTVSRRDFVGEIPVLGLGSIVLDAERDTVVVGSSAPTWTEVPPLPLRRHPLNQQPPQTSLRFPDVCISIALFRYCVESGSKNSRSLHPPTNPYIKLPQFICRQVSCL